MSDRPQGSATPPTPEKRSSNRTWRSYAAIAIAIVVLIFIVQNSQDVAVDLIFSTTTAPLFFVLLITFVAGAAVGWLLPRVRNRRKQRES